MYAVGGMRRREALKSAEKFDVKEGRWKTIGEVDFKNASDSLSNILIGGRYELEHQFVGNKAKERISKQVFQENKEHQIF